LVRVECACPSGEIAPGDELAEATSGSTGISFAAIGRAHEKHRPNASPPLRECFHPGGVRGPQL
jgi:hypothetical protein